MQLLLVRHAHALEGEPDETRRLSVRGWRQVRTVGGFLQRRKLVTARECWHSPLVRAGETARGLAEHLEFNRLRTVDGLLPEDDPRIFARVLARTRRSVLVVGHEPHLSALASLLLAGAPEPALIALRKGAVAALERERGRYRLLWLADPALMG